MPTEPIIRVENLGKLYRLGEAERRAETLFESLASLASAPMRNLRRLRGLDAARHSGDAEDPGLLWALRDVSFEVHRGEVMGIIGRNGAGKSTLLKVLSRITEPTRGRVRLKGRISSLLEVGTGFHPELSGRENVYLNGTILGMSKREVDRKFDEIVAFAGIERFLDTPVKRYSSGMTVRLGFAVAAHLEPDILIVDEVLAVGDADFQRKCLGKMQDVARGGDRTVLLVSHNMESIVSLADRCLYLNAGQVAGLGPTDEVIDRYLEQFAECRSDAPGVFTPIPEPGRGSIVRSLEVISDGQRRDAIRMGSDLSFRITLDFGDDPPDHPSFELGIGLETLNGLRITSLGSRFAGTTLGLTAGEVVVTCDAGRLPLNQGQYAIRLNVALREGRLLESHERLAILHVVPADVHGSGAIPNVQQGLVYWNSSWRVDASPARRAGRPDNDPAPSSPGC
jgi:lipopolysaccharide transport system ATP-binding protein